MPILHVLRFSNAVFASYSRSGKKPLAYHVFSPFLLAIRLALLLRVQANRNDFSDQVDRDNKRTLRAIFLFTRRKLLEVFFRDANATLATSCNISRRPKL